MALSHAILDIFEVKFLHRREVVAKKVCTHLYTHIHTQKKLVRITVFFVNLAVQIREGDMEPEKQNVVVLGTAHHTTPGTPKRSRSPSPSGITRKTKVRN